MGLDMQAPQWSVRIHVLQVDWLIRAHVLYQTERGMELLHGHSTRATLNRACLVSALVSREGGGGYPPMQASRAARKVTQSKKAGKDKKCGSGFRMTKGRSREEEAERQKVKQRAQEGVHDVSMLRKG